MENKKKIVIDFLGEKKEVYLVVETYVYGGCIALIALNIDDEYGPEIFADITTNLCGQQPFYDIRDEEFMFFAFVDNEFNDWKNILKKEGIIKEELVKVQNGFKFYYGVLFDEKKLREYCGDEEVDKFIDSYKRTFLSGEVGGEDETVD